MKNIEPLSLKNLYNVEGVLVVSDAFFEGLKVAKPIKCSLDLEDILMHSLMGNIYADSRFNKGARIRTTSVKTITKVEHGFVVKTRNTTYFVGNEKFGESNGFKIVL